MTTEAIPSIESPDAIPGYRLEERLDARPERGALYQAWDLRRGEPVLVNVISPRLAGDRHYRERWDRHVRLLARTEHPALAPLVEVGETARGLFVVVERPDGIPLAQMLEEGPLTAPRALAILSPVAELLDRLREQRLFAGDLSPRGIVVGPSDRPRVIQLGLADVTLLGRRHGGMPQETFAYAAPEQLRGMAPGSRTDVYALAAVLFEAITGTRPFQASDVDADSGSLSRALIARRSLPAPAVSTRRLGMGPEVDAVLKRGLAEEPAVRPVSAGELMYRFQRALEQAGVLQTETLHESLPGSRQLGNDRLGHPATPTRSRSDATRANARQDVSSRTSSPGRDTVGHPAAPLEGRRTGSSRTVDPVSDAPLWANAVSEPARQGPADAPAARAATPPPPGTLDRRRGPERSAAVVRRRVLLAAVVTATIAAIVGSILALGGEDGPPSAAVSPPTLTGSSGALELRFPSSWQIVDHATRIPGLSLGDPLELAPRNPSGGSPGVRLVAGMVDATNAGLLSPALARRLTAEPTREAVRLGEHEGYRYRDVQLRGKAGRLTIYAIPTTRGVATVACSATASVGSPMADCEAVAVTLEILRGRPLPLGPSRDYARRVNAVIGRLEARRRTELRRLQQAKTVAGQGRRASDLVTVFAEAANRLEHTGRPPGTADIHPRLVAGLRGVQESYRALSRSAAAGDRPAYNAARRTVLAREAALASTLKRMRELGYRIR